MPRLLVTAIPLFLEGQDAAAAYQNLRPQIDQISGPDVQVLESDSVRQSNAGEVCSAIREGKRYPLIRLSDLPCLWVECSDNHKFCVALPKRRDKILGLFTCLADAAKSAESGAVVQQRLTSCMNGKKQNSITPAGASQSDLDAAKRRAPKPITQWVGGVVTVASGAATAYGLFKGNGAVTALAIGGMIFAIILLVVVKQTTKVSPKNAWFYDIVAKILVGFVVLYFIALCCFLFKTIVDRLGRTVGGSQLESSPNVSLDSIPTPKENSQASVNRALPLSASDEHAFSGSKHVRSHISLEASGAINGEMTLENDTLLSGFAASPSLVLYDKNTNELTRVQLQAQTIGGKPPGKAISVTSALSGQITDKPTLARVAIIKIIIAGG